uniref:Uncharacterized protein n=1 Tax=Marseillevirus LCMAC202 TaxID=2506606 RepID=A0A481YZ60_9VIRU|nr:MAG: hypothetical protein LCMAC202_00820 [Marseillevirus LCMAC202]
METLRASLGQFYFTTHSNAPPTFLQVVGWTKGAERHNAKRRYVYVRKVPLHIQNSIGGSGYWQFDEDVIKRYAADIIKPVHKSTQTLVDGNAIIIDGAHFLRYQSITVPLRYFDYAPVIIPLEPESILEDELCDELLDSPEPKQQFKRLRRLSAVEMIPPAIPTSSASEGVVAPASAPVPVARGVIFRCAQANLAQFDENAQLLEDGLGEIFGFDVKLGRPYDIQGCSE